MPAGVLFIAVIQLLSYRRSANVLKYMSIAILADCGLLRYRGSRGGLAHNCAVGYVMVFQLALIPVLRRYSS